MCPGVSITGRTAFNNNYTRISCVLCSYYNYETKKILKFVYFIIFCNQTDRVIRFVSSVSVN